VQTPTPTGRSIFRYNLLKEENSNEQTKELAAESRKMVNVGARVQERKDGALQRNPE
jgi:hypothetical protein